MRILIKNSTAIVITTILFLFGSILFTNNRVSARTDGEFIVEYKAEFSPDELTRKSNSERERNSLVQFLQTISRSVVRQPSPLEHLRQIQSADSSIGVTEKHKLFSDIGMDSVYLIRYSKPFTVEEAISRYRFLPEVALVEPNYLTSESGI